MFDRNLRRGGIGCGVQTLIFVLLPFLLLGALWQVFNLISDSEPLEYIPTSAIAAQRCRDKFNLFKSNDYVRQITLTEMEINSAIQEDIQKSTSHVAKTWVKMETNSFTLEGVWSVVDLSLPEKEVSSLELKSKRESLWRLRIRFRISGRLEVRPGELEIVSPKVVLGEFELPQFVVSFLKKLKPGLFSYSILPQIKHVWLKKGAIELIKD